MRVKKNKLNDWQVIKLILNSVGSISEKNLQIAAKWS